MAGYTEYYTVVYRNDKRVVILNQDATPTKKPVLKKSKSKYYEPIQITNNRFNPRIVNGGDNPSKRWSFPLF